jgi:hypothetical protein
MAEISEKEVKGTVCDYFRREGFFVPKKEVPIDLRPEVTVRPDVSAFKWKNEYEIECIAVECKGITQPKSLIETSFTQAREYQLFFPYVYIAAPKLAKNNEETLKNSLRLLGMGLISSDRKQASLELRHGSSPRLNNSRFLYCVRQRAAAILTFKDLFKEPHFTLTHDEVDCFDLDAPNYLLWNANIAGNYEFGLCIEKIENVGRALGNVSVKDFYDSLVSLPAAFYVALMYIETYKPREVSWSVLNESVEHLSHDDAQWILDYSRSKKWKTRLLVMSKVWCKNEVLGRKECTERVQKIKSELLKLRTLLTTKQ